MALPPVTMGKCPTRAQEKKNSIKKLIKTLKNTYITPTKKTNDILEKITPQKGFSEKYKESFKSVFTNIWEN